MFRYSEQGIILLPGFSTNVGQRQWLFIETILSILTRRAVSYDYVNLNGHHEIFLAPQVSNLLVDLLFDPGTELCFEPWGIAYEIIPGIIDFTHK